MFPGMTTGKETEEDLRKDITQNQIYASRSQLRGSALLIQISVCKAGCDWSKLCLFLCLLCLAKNPQFCVH